MVLLWAAGSGDRLALRSGEGLDSARAADLAAKWERVLEANLVVSTEVLMEVEKAPVMAMQLDAESVPS